MYTDNFTWAIFVIMTNDFIFEAAGLYPVITIVGLDFRVLVRPSLELGCETYNYNYILENCLKRHISKQLQLPTIRFYTSS